MADAWFVRWLEAFEAQQSDWDYYDVWLLLVDGTFPLGALTTAYTIADASITGSEVSGTGYTTGGKLLVETSAGFVKNGDGTVSLNALGDIVWTNSTITARYGVLYTKDNNTLIALYDFGGNMSSSNSDLVVSINTATPILDVNYNPTHIIGSQAFDHIGAYSSGYNDNDRRYHLVSSDYTFDPANSAYSQIEPYIISSTSSTYSAITSAIEGGELVYRPNGDVVVFIAGAASAYRYVIAVERFAEIWMMVHDFVDDQPSTGQQVIIELPNGLHKVVQVT